MTIREKLLDFKRRLSDRKMYSIMIAIISVVACIGIYQYKRASNLRQELDNQYNRAFFDLVGYVNNVETIIAKSLITSTPDRTAAILQEAWRQSNLAQTNLGQLPVSQQVLANTSKFLTQVGDMAYTLNNQNMSGKYYNDQQYKTLEKLHGYAVALNNNLKNLQNQLLGGRIKWKELSTKGTPLFKKTSTQFSLVSFENLNKSFQDIPTLIYDGPFSEHMTKVEAKGLNGKQIDSEDGKLILKKFLDSDKINKITKTGDNNNANISSYSYKVDFRNSSKDTTLNIDISKKGGQVLWMLNNRDVSKSTKNIDEAKSIANKFLMKNGYKNMVNTYYLTEDNIATINYAYSQNNVKCYPDLIKVKVALDNGEVVGFESTGYVFSHTERNITPPKVSIDEAKSKINKRINIKSSGLAIIPTDYKTELYTYEFIGKLNDKDFLIYINAETGKEEKILMIVNTPNGVLTM